MSADAEPPRILFLPGMSGGGEFWQPVWELLPADWRMASIDWAGFGSVPPSADLAGYDDMLQHALAHLDALDGADREQGSGARPVLVAQSMGCLIAMRLALAAPQRISRLVLAVAALGLNVEGHGGASWEDIPPDQRPPAPRWASEPIEDLMPRLDEITAPTLLLWATHDPISPLGLGRELESRMPDARLVAFDTDDHRVARTCAAEAAAEIERFIAGVEAPA